MYYVYVILDITKPGHYIYGDHMFNFEPFYIGKGKTKRVKMHFYPSVYNSRNTPFYNEMGRLMENGHRPIYEIILDGMDEDTAYSYEHDTISLIGTRFSETSKGPLLNLNLGGDGGISPSPDTINKISKANTGRFVGKKNGNYEYAVSGAYKGENNPYYGKKHTDEIKSRMSRDYWLVEPSGVVVEIKNLQQYCDDNDLNLGLFFTRFNEGKRYKQRLLFPQKKYSLDDIINFIQKMIEKNAITKMNRSYREQMDIQLPEAIINLTNLKENK